MNSRSKIWMALTAVVFLAAITASAASARWVSPWVGRWQTMDIPGDGSTNTLTISFRPGIGNYNLIWQETYFSICDGDPGIGRGTGTEAPGGLATTFDFYCNGAHTLTIDIFFEYDAPTDTIVSDPEGMNQTWERITPRPW